MALSADSARLRWYAIAVAALVLAGCGLLLVAGGDEKLAAIARGKPESAALQPAMAPKSGLVIVDSADDEAEPAPDSGQAIGKPKGEKGAKPAAARPAPEEERASDPGESYVIIDRNTPVRAASDEELILSTDPDQP